MKILDFSEITSVVVLSIYKSNCITESCITDPIIISENLMASSFLERDTLAFKIINAIPHYYVNPTDNLDQFYPSILSLAFVFTVFIISAILIGVMYHFDKQIFKSFQRQDPSFYTNSSSSDNLNMYKDLIQPQFLGFENTNYENFNNLIQNQSSLAVCKRPFIIQHTSPSDGDTSPNTDILYDTKQVKYENYLNSQFNLKSQNPLLNGNVSSLQNMLIRHVDFGKWLSLANIFEQYTMTELFPRYINDKNGIQKNILCNMDYDELLCSNFSQKLSQNIKNNKFSEFYNDLKRMCKNLDSRFAKKLFKIGTSKYEGIDLKINTLIHDLIKNNIVISLEHLSQVDIMFLEMKNEQGLSPLHTSVIYSQYKWIELLCNNGVSLDSCDKNVKFCKVY